MAGTDKSNEHAGLDREGKPNYQAVEMEDYPLHDSSTTAPTKMNKTKALRLLGLKGDPSLDEIQVAYDGVFEGQVSDPRKALQLVDAKVYLEQTYASKLNPIVDLVAMQNKKGGKELKKMQQDYDYDFLLLSQFATDMVAIGQAYLEEASQVGAKPDVLHKAYMQKGKELSERLEDKKYGVRHAVIHAQMMPVMKPLIVDKPYDTVTGSKVGPVEKIKQQKSAYGHSVEARLAEVGKVIQDHVNFLAKCQEAGASIVDFNTQFAENLQNSDVSSIEDAEQNRENYNNVVQALTVSLSEEDAEKWDEVSQIFSNLTINQDRLVALQDRARQLASTTDPIIRSFIHHYDDYMQQIEALKRAHPEAEEVLDKASKKLYELGAQYLIALQQRGADQNQLHQQFDKLYEQFIQEHHDKLQNTGVLSEYELIRSELVNKGIFNARLSFEDHIEAFKDKYEQYLGQVLSITDENNPAYPYMAQLKGRLEAIGEKYLKDIQDPENNVDGITEVYQKEMQDVIQRTKTDLEEAAVETPELWPRLNGVLKVLASIIYIVRYMIKSADAEIAERNKLFAQSEESFEQQMDNWLIDTIPTFEGRNQPDPDQGRDGVHDISGGL
ncbi:MAG: hypothetical protein NXI01_05610 [Gammaproteobacteria bacterium]|nr:hypothetical protein [Gammaproteobacteria bacterium]